MIKASEMPLYKQYNLYLVVDGTVPMGSGLSSSSALVCSSLLTTCRAFNIHNKISKEELAQLAADSERYGMNVQIGGMDQAISFLGEINQAQYITFEPKLDHQAIGLPIGISFVVAHTLVGAHKNESAAHNYNRRVIECRLATALLAKALLNGTVLTEYHTLHWLQADELNESLENMIQYCNRYLIRDSYDLEHVAAELGLASVDEQKKRFFGNIELAHEKDFKLRQRALHVFSEAKRVLDAVKLCSETNLDSDQTAIEFGKLMNQSHFSCRDLFECSCKELNELTEYSRSVNGCLGSRLTGAGWGGCCVSLVKDSSVQEFIEFIWNKYYKDNPNTKDLNRNEYLFASHPASGAAIYEPNK
jgi:N-acetylgalactosamine kinase